MSPILWEPAPLGQTYMSFASALQLQAALVADHPFPTASVRDEKIAEKEKPYICDYCGRIVRVDVCSGCGAPARYENRKG